MKRKLIKQGSGEGLVVYLPREWIKENNLSQGDEVEIENVNESLVIESKDKFRKNEKKINIKILSSNEKIMRIYLKNISELGYHNIICEIDSKENERILSEVVDNHLSNWELIRKSENKLEFEILSETYSKRETIFLEKIFFFIENTLQLLYDSTENKDNLEFKERIIKNSKKISTYENICKRNINLKLFDNNKLKLTNLLSYLILLDHILLEFSKEKIKEKELLLELLNLFKETHKIYLKKSNEGFEKINIELQKIMEQEKKNIGEKENSLEHHFYYNISRHIYLITIPLITLNFLEE
jgi:antitoxin component of MazEF toxin-antitoxin module